MKRYKRRKAFIKPKVLYIVLICSILLILISAVSNFEAELIIILCSILSVTLLITFMNFLGTCQHFSCGKDGVTLSSFRMRYKTFRYNAYSIIMISNASYLNGYENPLYSNIPMLDDSDENGRQKKPLPYISLCGPSYPVNRVKPGMLGSDLRLIGNEIAFVGICWFDALNELLINTNLPVYLLEDVYLGHKHKFDKTFVECGVDPNRLFIISDNIVEYVEYAKNN